MFWSQIFPEPLVLHGEPRKRPDLHSPARMAEIASRYSRSGSPSKSPRFRDPSDPARGLIGFGISDTKPVTSAFMERCLRALGLTIAQYNAWTGYRTLVDWLGVNFTHYDEGGRVVVETQRSWFELVAENLETIRGA